jgi:DNA-binding NtrC family response regulator
VLEADDLVIRASTIEPWLKAKPTMAMSAGTSSAATSAAAASIACRPLADVEKELIMSTLRAFQGHRVRTASALGIGVRTLGMKLKKWKEEQAVA